MADIIPNQGGSGTTAVVPNTDQQPIHDRPPLQHNLLQPSQLDLLPTPRPDLPPPPWPDLLPTPQQNLLTTTQPNPQSDLLPTTQPNLLPPLNKGIPGATILAPNINRRKTESSLHENLKPGLPPLNLVPAPSSKQTADDALNEDE
ncbi:hypothetical protein PSTG_18408, partial [Puccinia striiformis f. sp. tritici PST-78]